MSTEKNTIKNWFKTGLKPTQAQFWATWDSFWHKDEKLPISSIENLGNLIDGKAEANHSHAEYATNSATSLTPENVTQWQNKLGVADLKFDDQAITTTQDYAEFGLDSGATINAFNNAVYSEVLKKLNAPIENNTSDYVLLADGSTAPQTDFGKVDKVMGIAPDVDKNVDISGVAMNWTNANQQFSGLVDKSTDATFNQFTIIDSNGKFAKASKPFNAFKNFLTQCTISESTELGQLLNGGQGSSGAISVNLISPPIIQNRFNNVEYVLLRGANLLLNSTDMSINICDANKNVIQQIPNNQIINNSTSELVFYYNFHLFPTGTYYVKITSGVKVYYTTLDLKVTEHVENINLASITWEKLYESTYVPSISDYAEGGNVSITVPGGSFPEDIRLSFKSSEIFAEGENWYLEVKVDINNDDSTYNSTKQSFIGIGYSDTNNSLLPLTLVNISHAQAYNTQSFLFYNGNKIGNAFASPLTRIIAFIKTGNIIRMVIGGSNYVVTLSNNSGYSIFMQSVGRYGKSLQQLQVIRAFKFN